MRRASIAFALALSAPAFAADNIYLVCTLVSAPDLDVARFYKVQPKDYREFFKDAMALDVLPVTRLFPPTKQTYVVRTNELRFEYPDGTQVLEAQARITDASIAVAARMRGYQESFSLDRLTGLLENWVWLDTPSTAKWLEAHGKPIPQALKWTSQCEKVGRRF